MEQVDYEEFREGNWVKVAVPMMGRAALGSPMISMLIVQRNDRTGKYRLANKRGILAKMVDVQQMFKQAELRVPDACEVMEAYNSQSLKKMSLRALAGAECRWGGQGRQNCKCRHGCQPVAKGNKHGCKYLLVLQQTGKLCKPTSTRGLIKAKLVDICVSMKS
jgi:hypothetical protein